MNQVYCTATPQSTLMDEVVSVRVNGLQHGQKVTIVTRLEEDGNKCLGYGWYTANHEGLVTLETAECTGGTYSGVEPMGLFWSMLPEREQKAGMRLIKRDIRTPYHVEITVYDGHFDAMDTHERDACAALTTTRVERWYMGGNVQRTEVRDGRLVATFFIPNEGTDYPGVLDLFGTVGGILEHRAALLASRGFATMALCYFNPSEEGVNADLEYFEEAVEYIHNHPRVSKRGVGVVGVSKGAELALLTAVISQKVKAVVSINGSYHNNLIEHTYRGEVFSVTQPNLSAFKLNENGWYIWRHWFDDLDKEELEGAAIPTERSDAHFLVVYGGDDQSCPPTATEYIPKRMAAHGKADKCRVLIYPKAGHLLEPPIAPICTHSYHAAFKGICLWGGEVQSQARAQEDLWLQMQHFFRHHLLSAETSDLVKISVASNL